MPQQITNIASCGIIYRKENPRDVFLEIKDDGHPIALAHRCFAMIGGNWIGAGARTDENPLGTFRREFTEEFCFEKATSSTVELELLGQTDHVIEYRAPVRQVIPTSEDRASLCAIREAVLTSCVPFGTWINSVSVEAIRAADPKSTMAGFSTLVAYWAVPLDETMWSLLVGLQQKYGNLSNESLSMVTSLEAIVGTGLRGAFSHEVPLQAFFLAMGLTEAHGMIVSKLQSSTYAGPALASYADYLARYDIARHP